MVGRYGRCRYLLNDSVKPVTDIHQNHRLELVAHVFLQLIHLSQGASIVGSVVMELYRQADLNSCWPDVSAFQPRDGFEDPLRSRVGRCGIRNKASAGVGPSEHRSRAGYFHDHRIAGSHVSPFSSDTTMRSPGTEVKENVLSQFSAKPG